MPVCEDLHGLADAFMQVDPSVTFDQVGGLDGYIDKLKEMIFLPLVYPELFERFHVNPPRGVLLYGPPGESAASAAACPASTLQPQKACTPTSPCHSLSVSWPRGGCYIHTSQMC